MTLFRTRTVETPTGLMILGAADDELCLAEWLDSPGHARTMKGLVRRLRVEPIAESTPVLDRAADALTAYFAGQRQTFDLPLRLVGTPFQCDVWRALLQIPFGTTCAYGDIARTVGRPTAFRAVAQAIGRNPVCIIVPCHRVIGRDGSLTGFGSGLPRKIDLLQREGLWPRDPEG